MQKHRLIALAIGLSAILAACSSSGASTAPSAAPSAAAPSAAPSEAPSASAPDASASASAPAAAGTTVALADTSLGKVLVDGKGMTLYMFTPDEDQAASTCGTGCIDKWPALIADSPTAGPGLDASKLSTVARADGSGNQVKYGEYFLYTFANDKAAGDVNGQGVGTKWYVIGADGEPIK
jgi:predicted lipoprotein with Yx(FWY)xxD motif